MDRLWAPWRKKFLHYTQPTGCIFCQKPKTSSKKSEAKNLLLFRGKKVFSMLNLYPYNNGHVLIAPYRHVASPLDLTGQEDAEMTAMLRMLLKKMQKTLRPQGYNIGMNVGRVAGAGFDKHIHMHAVPRWRGDVNFMSMVADNKVLSESLQSLRQKLLACK